MNSNLVMLLTVMDNVKIWKSGLINKKRHLLFWLIFISYETSAIYFMGHGFAPLKDYLIHYFLNISLFYSNALLVLKHAYGKPSFFAKGTFWGLSVLVVYLGIKYLLNLLFVATGTYTSDEIGDLTSFFGKSIWRALYFIGLSTTYVFIVSTVLQRKRISNLELSQLKDRLEQQKLEQNLLSSENAFLKAQINPHFLFNSLNFIQNYVANYSEKGSELIIRLAEVMRYAFAEPSIDGKIELETEITQLYNYQHLNNLRFNQELFLVIKVTGDTKNIRIIPLLLITVLENIYKYAELTDINKKANFSLNVHNGGINLLVHNFNARRNHVSSSGVGMTNLQKRLNQHYYNQYTLNVRQTHSDYQLNLTIAIPVYEVLYN